MRLFAPKLLDETIVELSKGMIKENMPKGLTELFKELEEGFCRIKGCF